MPAHPKNWHPYSPNLEHSQDEEAEAYWLQLSDFNEWPYITLFDDAKDLEEKLEKADLDNIHIQMVKEVELKKYRLQEALCETVIRL